MQKLEEDFSTSALTRRSLRVMEAKKRGLKDIWFDRFILFFPFLCCGVAIGEYLFITDLNINPNPHMYLGFLIVLGLGYAFWLIFGSLRRLWGVPEDLEQVRYEAPRLAALFLILAAYDYMTLKTGILTQPFVPALNYVLNIAWEDRAYLWDSTLHTLVLLFLGYAIGVLLGLITGIMCGYSKKARYWVQPIIQFLGPIPTSTWIPIVMVISTSLFGGAVFIIAMGSWFAVTVASMTGIATVDNQFYEAARTLGASERQLVFHVAIPHAMPSILQGATQALSSACTAILVAEMMGVESGLGWYMTWAKSWAAYDKMFAALFVICIIFTLVTKVLGLIKRRMLSWQTGVVK